MMTNTNHWIAKAILPTLTILIFLGTTSNLLGQEAPKSSDKEIQKLKAQLREQKDAYQLQLREAEQLKGQLNSLKGRNRPKTSRTFPQPARSPESLPALATRAPQPAAVQQLPARPVQVQSPFVASQPPGWVQDPAGVRFALPRQVQRGYAKQQESQRKVAELMTAISTSEDDSKKEELKAELKAQLESQYDAYLENLEAPLKKMEERLDQLREEYEKRKSARDELVKLRLGAFWQRANGMTWPGESTQGNPFSVQGRAMFPSAPASVSNVFGERRATGLSLPSSTTKSDR